MRQTRIATRCALACAALAACAPDQSGGPFSAADSAGVLIASSTAPAWGPGHEWRVDTVPLMDIGGDADGAEGELGEVSAALLSDDGGVIIAEESESRIRFHDSTGRLVRTVGRKGEGPGEYVSLSRLRRAGDSLITWDPDLLRVSVLAADGSYGRSFTVAASSGAGLTPRPEGRWSDGSFLFSDASGTNSRMTTGPVTDTLTVLRFEAAGSGDSVLGRWAGRETVAVTGSNFISSIDPPYGRVSAIRWSEDGFWVGTAEEARIDLHDPRGRLLRSVRWSAARPAVGGGEHDAWRERTRKGLEGLPPGMAPAFLEAVERTPFPDRRPPYASFIVAGDGALWVARVPRWDAADSAGTWDVLDAEGRWLGPVPLPPRVVPLDVREGRLLARWTDPDGADHIRVYRLIISVR